MKQIRESKFSKIVAYYLILMMILQVTQPMQMYALTSGPTQPEFNAFTPIGTSDMVSLSTGDFNYNIPIMDVGGYPLNLAYNSGVTMDQESSWVGLGWNLNVGEISRQVRGLPDDFRGDGIRYENNLKDNVTIGTNMNVSPALLGLDAPISLGLGVQFNNYEGITFKPSVGISYSIAGMGQVGVDLSGAVGEGATLSPSVSISGQSGKVSGSLGLSAGLSSRKGLESMSMSASASTKGVQKNVDKATGNVTYSENNDPKKSQSMGSASGSLSFNNQSYTPSKRIAFNNVSKTFNATIGGEVFGVEGQVRISGYGSYQGIADGYKDRFVGAYGYENTQYKNGNEGVLDFNREKEQTVSRNTNVLPVTNYTYDTYNIEGQGVSGMFRPYRSQVGYLYNDNVTDVSSSQSFGAEIGFGNLIHGGVDFSSSPTVSTTGLWREKNYALPVFTESSNTNKKNPLYEPSTFKLVGELNVDNESDIYTNKLKSNQSLRIELAGGEYNRYALPSYTAKSPISAGIPTYTHLDINNNIKREGRLLRNQTVQKITNKEAKVDNQKFFFPNTNAKEHHTAGMKVLQADGTTYIYGRTVYNKSKVEATFDVSGRGGDNTNGIVNYNGSVYGNQGNHSDEYVNRVTTPAYAHTFLITSVLSSDYQDLDNNGPSDKDLGGYTKFGYTIPYDYKWRVPYGLNQASYSEGLKSSAKDQKGNYIYGVKELTYLNKIETKTHIAFIDLDNRADAMGVAGENGGTGTQVMKYIKSIRLYSKSELSEINGNYTDPGENGTVKPIKTAHFEYDYSLCKNIPSNSGAIIKPDGITNINLNKGKLTLKKVYFTYRASNMGKYTPYKFDYAEADSKMNPNYALKGFDIWGNYRPVVSGPTNSEFPFVKQDQNTANEYTSVWTLKSVTLPSGGKISIDTESDDYKYVQNKKAMQMFKVVGAGDSSEPSAGGTNLYEGNGFGNHNKFIYVKVSDAYMTPDEFKNKYLLENLDKPIYFKFLMNMRDNAYDYVSGYFEIDQERLSDINVNPDGLVAIPLKFLDKEGGWSGGSAVNPIAKSGWGFGRANLNRLVYSMGGAESNFDFESIVKDLVGSIQSMAEIFTGPNQYLEIKGCARNFDPNQSWIRLENPIGKKLGGGLRVKKISLSDNWGIMNSDNDNPIYNEQYGQEYKYNLTDGSSSGVATFEPNACPENALVEPFYGSKDGNYAERIGSPRELNYAEKPFGETFFPSPKITYSKVTVSNLNKNPTQPANGDKVIKKHATGKVVTEHYTTYDFPTIVDFTELLPYPDSMKSPIWNMLSVRSVDHLVASQGFSIETNDMDGKLKSEKVYPEGEEPNEPISRVDYKYNVGTNGKLDNVLKTIDSKGNIVDNLLGVEYDVINDFNESRTVTESSGMHVNIASFLIALFPVFIPMPIPNEAYHETLLRTATTTKVVHKTGILQEKIAYDLGSRVSTKNLAWDAKSGQVLLTQTINEFDDKYFSFNYPAYWNYENMGMASDNIDLSGKLNNISGFFNISGYSLPSSSNISTWFKIGDELLLGDGTKVWVTGYSSDKMRIQLMKSDGTIINSSNLPSNLDFKVVRSGNRNQQTAMMASVTSMVNPLTMGSKITDATFGYQSGATFNPRVINASAVEYSDDWKSQCENALPNENGFFGGITTGIQANPYLYNTKGNWRALRSHAYLTGRNNFETTNRRKTGYFASFSPFYSVDNNGLWSINNTNWTFASEVTKYSPYGVELENKDALQRYSGAQYGYKYKLPVAVASNSRYSEMGFDGFEDYDSPFIASILNKPHFGFSQGLVENEVFLTSDKSHTGNNSIAIKAGKKATFTRKIGGCKTQIIAKSNLKVAKK